METLGYPISALRAWDRDKQPQTRALGVQVVSPKRNCGPSDGVRGTRPRPRLPRQESDGLHRSREIGQALALRQPSTPHHAPQSRLAADTLPRPSPPVMRNSA